MLYKTGLILGRFQPIHRGHLYLIETALQECDKVIIAIGSTNLHDEKNPFTLEEREVLITKALDKTHLLDRVAKIVGVEDNPDDDVWLANLILKTGGFDVVYGNNEWPNLIFEAAGHKVIRIELYRRELYEGTKIRNDMKNAPDSSKIIEKYLS